jgi:hypothetical protein
VAADEEARRARVEERAAKKQADRDRQRKQRRFEEVEAKIAEAEAELQVARAALAEDHGGDWQRLNGLVAEERRLSERVKSLMGEWEKLGSELAGT